MNKGKTISLFEGRVRLWRAVSGRVMLPVGTGVEKVDGVANPPQDGIWLAESIDFSVYKGRVLDAFCGTGVVGLCAVHLGAQEVLGVDSHAPSVRLANANAVLNGWGELYTAQVGEVGALDFEAGAFDVVMANPPFYGVEAGFESAVEGKARTRGLSAGDLAVWLGDLWRVTAKGGVLAVILHVREVDAVRAFVAGLGGEVSARYEFIETVAGRAPKRVVVVLGVEADKCIHQDSD